MQMATLGDHFDFSLQKKYMMLNISLTITITVGIVVYTLGWNNIAFNITFKYVLSYISYLVMTASRLTLTFVFTFYLLSTRRRFIQINKFMR